MEVCLSGERSPYVGEGIFIDMDGNTGHCVVFLGSKLYNNSWDDPKSKIYLMNPAFESIREVTLTEINDTYNIIYCK